MQLHLLTQQVIKYKLLRITKLKIVVKCRLCNIKFTLLNHSRAEYQKYQKQALNSVKLSYSNTCADVRRLTKPLYGALANLFWP